MTRSRSARAARLSCLLPALLLAAAPLCAWSADTVRWPLAWQAGDRWVYETESIDREIRDGQPSARRTTDRTEVRVEAAGKDGYVQSWTTTGSRVEVLEGDRADADALAPVLDELDGFSVVVGFDRRGRYSGVRNLDATAAKIRTAMQPAVERIALGGSAGEAQALQGLDPAQAAEARDLMRQQLSVVFDMLFSTSRVAHMTTTHARTATDHVGGSFRAGKRYRDATPMRSPLDGLPLPATREYVVTLDDRDPNLARLAWTHALDPQGAPAALWTLAAELENGGLAPARGAGDGRPKDLDLREDGFALFRRDTGVLELLQVQTLSRYGQAHDERERNRLRLVDSARTWAQEDAAAP